jgi:signal transduction histidine kinase
VAARVKALRFLDWPVRVKLAALLVVASVVPLAITSALDLRTARTRLRGNVADLLAARGEQLRGELDTFHRGYQLSAANLAHVPALIALGEGTAAGELAVAPVRELIDRRVANDANLRSIAVLDRTGIVVASTDLRMMGRPLGQRRFVRDALRGAPGISEVGVMDPDLDDTPVIAYVAPVPGTLGPVGLVVLWLRATALWQIARSANELAGPGSFAVVLDTYGIRIAHTSSEDIVFHPAGALAPAVLDALTAERRFGPGTRALLEDVRAFPAQFVRARAAAPDAGLFGGYTPSNAMWTYGVARRLTTVPWTVFYMLPEAAIDTQIAAMTKDKVIVVAIIMVIAFVIGLVLAVVILRPVVALSSATAKLGSGDLATRVALVERDDEIGRLCASFNAMAARLQRHDLELRQSRDELELRVGERTAELVASTGRLEILSSIGHELAAVSGDVDVVLDLATRRIGETVGEGCAIRLISEDGGWLEPTEIFFYPDPTKREQAGTLLATTRQRVGEGIAGRVAASGTALLVPELTTERMLAVTTTALRPLLTELGAASALAIPLRSRQRTIGVVSLLRSTAGHPYTLDDQRFAQDVADRAGLAIDNAVLVSTLERRVLARTAALELANHELEAFSYSVSHDLRAPLRAIDGFSQILLAEHAGQLDREGLHSLERVRTATQRMSALIDDLLSLAQITRTQLRWMPIDLSAIADHIATELRRREPGRTTRVHIAPDVMIRGDARMLTIALENLLGNAWKFTAKHGAAEIWFGAEQRDGREVFFVRDSGAGFDMKYIDKLFGAFQRLHNANDYEGVGIGLATVQRIISRHGGQIWAKAAVDAGATFFFTLGTLGDAAEVASHLARG